jgi:dTDP-4-amino-4,6-dideoxygalactose transaminase
MSGFDDLFKFEEALAEYTGAPHVVLTDGCTHALELCHRYEDTRACEFTAYTYISVAQMMRHLNIEFTLTDEEWVGEYRFHGTNIWDSARRLEKGMYRKGQMQCLSFGHSKPLELGKVGAILLDDEHAYTYLSRVRSDSRDLRIQPWTDQKSFGIGFHYCPTLEDCRTGLEKLFNHPSTAPKYHQYPDLRTLGKSR